MEGLNVSHHQISIPDAFEVIRAFYDNDKAYFTELRERLKPRIEAERFTSGETHAPLHEYLSAICKNFGMALDESFSYLFIECLIDEIKDQNEDLWICRHRYEIAKTLAHTVCGQKEMINFSVRLPHIVYRIMTEISDSKHADIYEKLKKEMPDNYDPFAPRASFL